MTVDPPALARDHLDRLDRAAPGMVTALYLTGSAALGDFQPGSDVDAVAVLSRAADLDALRAAHAAAPERPYLDVIYLTDVEFDARLDAGERVPYTQDGMLRDDGCGQLNPVLWVELRDHARTLRGPTPAERGVTGDPARLRAWNVENLRTYWTSSAAGVHRYVTGRDGAEPVDAEIVCWNVLGPPRLHYTLATGGVITKTGAGRYAAERFPEWADLCAACVRCRAGEEVAFTVADLRAAADLMDKVISDALGTAGAA